MSEGTVCLTCGTVLNLSTHICPTDPYPVVLQEAAWKATPGRAGSLQLAMKGRAMSEWTFTDMAERGAESTPETWPQARRVEVARNILTAAQVPELVAEVERLREEIFTFCDYWWSEHANDEPDGTQVFGLWHVANATGGTKPALGMQTAREGDTDA